MDAINSDNRKSRDRLSSRGKGKPSVSGQTKSTVTCTESIGLGQLSLPPPTAAVVKRTKNLQMCRKSYPSIHTRSSTSSSSTSTMKRPYQSSNPQEPEAKSNEVPVKITRANTKARNEQERSSIAMAGPDPPVDPIQDIVVDGDRDQDTNVSLPRPYRRRKKSPYVFRTIESVTNKNNLKRKLEINPNAPSDSAGPIRNSNIQIGEGSKGQGQGQQQRGDVKKDKNTIRVQKNGSNSVSRVFPKKSTGCWYPVTFESTKDSAAKTHKINNAGIRVSCEKRSEKLSRPFITQENIKQVFSGLVDFRIQIEKNENTRTSTGRTATGTETDTKGIIQLITERPLEKNELEDWNVFESVVKPEERINKELKFVLLEYFVYHFSKKIRIPRELFAEGKSKLQSIFKLDFVSLNAYQNVFTFNVNLSSQAILGDENYDKGIWEELEAKDTIPILNYFLKPNNKPKHPNSGGAALSKSDSDSFYSLTRDFRTFDDVRVPHHDIPNLIARLKDYQEKAVRWMLKREEDIDKHNSQTRDKFIALQDFIQKKMYIPTQLRIGNENVYYCPTSGQVVLEKYKERIQKFPSGGILADEIGLGKTFEMLSVILMNKRPGFEDVAQDVDNVGDEVEEVHYGPRSTSTSAQDKPKVKAKRTPIMYVTPSKQTQREGTQIQCRCGQETADRNDKEIKILTCTGTKYQCNAKHHATCFGYDPKYLTEEVVKNYLCPTCVSKNEPVPSKSTLIVVPDSILHQWEDEICHNVADLHYLVYRGMSDQNSKYQPAVVLSQNDIVLTTYEVLKAEIPFTGLHLLQPEYTRESRYEKRYVPLPSPLTSVGWWRVCLDEAQLVVNVKSNLSKLACRLPAVHRWCITGTPIVHSIQDLFGLVTFLGVEPICKEIHWETMIMEPFRRADTENIKNIFGPFFWRTGKEEVAHELELPMQTEVFHKLELSPVEKLSHAARYRFWSDKLEQELKNFCDLDPSSESEIRCPLNNATKTIVEKMRQICIHPQLEDVNNGENGHSMAKFNLKGLLSKLIKEGEDVCSRQYKPLVTSLNVLAGLNVLKKGWSAAAQNYKHVYDISEKYQGVWNTRDIQLLHAVTSLIDLMQSNYEEKTEGTSEMNSCSVEDLRKLVETTKEVLLKKEIARLVSITEEIKTSNEKVRTRMEMLNLVTIEAPTEMETRRKEEEKTTEAQKLDSLWFGKILTVISNENLFNELVDQIKKSISIEKLKDTSEYAHGDGNTFESPFNLFVKLEKHILEIKKSRDDVCTVWSAINNESVDKTYGHTSKCYSHGTEAVVTASRSQNWQLCLFVKKLKHFEQIFFRYSQKLGANAKGGRQSEIDKLKPYGNWWSDKSITQIILDEIITLSKKIKTIPKNVIEQGEAHSQLFKELKAQFWLLGSWMLKKESQISALNNIIQSTKPLAPLACTKILNHFQVNLLFSGGVGVRTLPKDRIVKLPESISKEVLIVKNRQSDFDKSTKHLSKLQTLEALDENGHGKYGSVNPENCSYVKCPKEPLGQKWGVLPCGHCICNKCCDGVNDTEASFVCPQSGCTKSFQYSDIVLIDTESPRQTSEAMGMSEWPLSAEVISGEPFAKVEGVIRTLKSIAINHQNEKVLVVTAWRPMLEVLRVAFKKNKIPFTNYAGGESSRSALKAFRKGKLDERNRDNDKDDPHPQNKEECEWWKQVLLMPLSVASTGLNLTEASHILLVEPILNMSSELQAIGRIHRLGQTRETYIHRFYVVGTVEEKFLKRREKKMEDDAEEQVLDFEEENMSIADLKELLM